MIRRAILNVAVNPPPGGWYEIGQQRLFDSLEERREGATRLFWRDQLPPGAPTHQEAPYAFKPYAFEEARHLGFDQAVWLDASCWALKPLNGVWACVDEDGWYLEPDKADGHVVGEWISDQALGLLALKRDEAMALPLIEGKLIGLDFRNGTANQFLDEWTRLADSGGFAGAWSNQSNEVSPDPRCRGHRHDIACGSPVAYRLGMRLQPFKRIGFPGNGATGDEIVVFAEGM